MKVDWHWYNHLTINGRQTSIPPLSKTTECSYVSCDYQQKLEVDKNYSQTKCDEIGWYYCSELFIESPTDQTLLLRAEKGEKPEGFGKENIFDFMNLEKKYS